MMLNSTEASKAVGLTREHLARLAKSGALEGAIKPGRDWLFSFESIEKMILDEEKKLQLRKDYLYSLKDKYKN
jgi:hypothetical protein